MEDQGNNHIEAVLPLERTPFSLPRSADEESNKSDLVTGHELTPDNKFEFISHPRITVKYCNIH